jgi:hypothetical protein
MLQARLQLKRLTAGSRGGVSSVRQGYTSSHSSICARAVQPASPGPLPSLSDYFVVEEGGALELRSPRRMLAIPRPTRVLDPVCTAPALQQCTAGPQHAPQLYMVVNLDVRFA